MKSLLLCLTVLLSSVGWGTPAEFGEARWIGENPIPFFCPAATNQFAKSFKKLPKIAKNCVRFRKRFDLPSGEILSAVLSVTALGGYSVSINGRELQPLRMLAPSWSDPDSRVLYETQDVRGFLKAGAANCLGLWVSPGYSDDYNSYGWRWTKPKRAIAALTVTFADGRCERLVTDGSWEWTADQPLEQASIYYGEVCRAERRDPRWAEADGSRADWKSVAVLSDEGLNLMRDFGPPVLLNDPRRPVRSWTSANGNRVFDFGENRSGVVELRDTLPKGRKVRILYTEEAKDGVLDYRSHRGLRQRDVYFAAGDPKGEMYRPRFTYHGFRYCEVEGGVDPQVTAWQVTSDIREKATFDSSDETLNWLWDAARRSMRSNFVAFPTDCNMREERTPCLMDSQVYEDTAFQIYDIAGYYRRWMYDAVRYQDGFRLGEKGGNTNNPDWQGEPILLAERFLTYCAATNAALADYRRLKRTAEHFVSVATNGTWSAWAFGDWCPPDEKAPFASVPVVNSALLVACCRAMSRLARAKDEPDDVRRFDDLSKQTAQAFRRRFVHADGTVGDGVQTDYYMALAFGLVPPDLVPRACAALERRIRTVDDTHLASGIFGTRYFGDVLLENGLGDLWLEMLHQTTFPGFGFMKARGATTLWEEWQPYGGALGMESHNHAMRSGAVSCFLTHLGGIRPLADGYRRLLIRPVCPARLGRVAVTVETPVGKVNVRWQRTDQGLPFEIETPVPAELQLPGQKPRSVPAGSVRIVPNITRNLQNL